MHCRSLMWLQCHCGPRLCRCSDEMDYCLQVISAMPNLLTAILRAKKCISEMYVLMWCTAGVQRRAHPAGGDTGGRHPGLQVWALLCHPDGSHSDSLHRLHLCNYFGELGWQMYLQAPEPTSLFTLQSACGCTCIAACRACKQARHCPAGRRM